MKLETGFIDYSKGCEETECLVFTGNSFIKKNGGLVMGRGAAKQVRDSFPGIDIDLGSRIPHLGYYGVIEARILPFKLLAFQVKYGYMDQADLELITKSTQKMAHVAETNKNVTFHMNFPGVGNGRLAIQQVGPIIESLPNNVHVWR